MTKAVQLSDEAYARLKTLKRDDESFSDVVLRIVGRGGSLRDLGDLRTREEAERAESWIREIDQLDEPE